LYRIAQECLRNSGKHSHATEVRVTLFGGDHEISIEIVDNGRGFNLETTKGRRGLGLIAMEERANLLNGMFLVRSSPGKGTMVKVHLPLA